MRTFARRCCISLLRQLIPSVALFARHQKEVGIGIIGPERLILTPKGQLVLTEVTLGESLDKLLLIPIQIRVGVQTRSISNCRAAESKPTTRTSQGPPS
jgi:hypothetical protein